MSEKKGNMLAFLCLVATLIIMCPGCDFFKSVKRNASINKASNLIINLDESTDIIIDLIRKKDLAKVLEEKSSPESIELLIKNVSPAEMAFEAEILNQSKPAIIAFFKEDDPRWQDLRTNLAAVAQSYRNTVNFAEVNADKLFKITENSNVEIFPALIVIHERKEIARLEGAALGDLKDSVQKFLETTLKPLLEHTKKLQTAQDIFGQNR